MHRNSRTSYFCETNTHRISMADVNMLRQLPFHEEDPYQEILNSLTPEQRQVLKDKEEREKQRLMKPRAEIKRISKRVLGKVRSAFRVMEKTVVRALEEFYEPAKEFAQQRDALATFTETNNDIGDNSELNLDGWTRDTTKVVATLGRAYGMRASILPNSTIATASYSRCKGINPLITGLEYLAAMKEVAAAADPEADDEN